ncbi:MAG: butyrate kinase, partial [Paramuribaculum sp.]|nr:butyrate kinase [Paramuribaculum sp.]
MKILVINPGSTSTKWAVYNDRELQWKATRNHSTEELRQFSHVIDQLKMRTEATRQALAEAQIPEEFDVVIARGGLLRPTPSG